MTRPNLLVGALAAGCVGMLLWCARLILAADLPRGAHIASWVLWLVATTALVTLLAYLREFLTHRQAVGRDASWKPLPSLVLLWIGGLTALLSFAFMLPDKAAAEGADGPAKATTSLAAQTVTPAPSSTSAASGTTRPATSSTTSSTTSSRSVASRTAPPAPASTTTPRSTPTGGSSAARTPTTPSTPSTTSSPLIDFPVLPPPPWG